MFAGTIATEEAVVGETESINSYTYNMIENLGLLAELNSLNLQAAWIFRSGMYNTSKLSEDTIFIIPEWQVVVEMLLDSISRTRQCD